MRKILSELFLLVLIFILPGCNRNSLSELGLDTECDIMIRDGIDKDYDLITDEIIHSNILNLIVETLNGEAIEVPKEGAIDYRNDKEIQIVINSDKKFDIYFRYYLSDTRLDYLGEPCITIDDGKNKEHYFLDNELYSYVSFLLNHNTNIIEVKVYRITENQISVGRDDESDSFFSINYDELPNEIEVNANVEIKLAKATEDKKGLWIESICLKKEV